MTQTLIELMKARHSVRTYEKREIPKEVLEKVDNYLLQITKDYPDVKIKLIHQRLGEQNIKLGTYGTIKGASNFFIGVCQNSKEGYQRFGYVFEKVVLFCTSLGLGTCWMAGTYKKSDFAKVTQLEENEAIAIVSPLGWEASKNSIIGKIMSQKGKRYDFEKNFFDTNPSTPLTRTMAGKYETALEMVRIAPSAVNKQPWRVIRTDNAFHFYLDGKLVMQYLDIGIAMCHFEEAAKETGLHGHFEIQKPELETEWEYVRSWVED